MESAVQAIADGNGELPATSEITRTIGFSWGYPSLDELLDRYLQEHARMLQQFKQYVASTPGEGAMSAAQRISEALNVGLDEVLVVLQELGPHEPTLALAGTGSVASGSVSMKKMAIRGTVLVSHADVVRQIDVDELSAQASRGGLARLSANQRILVAVILIAAVFPALPPEARQVILEEAGLAAAIAAVLALLKWVVSLIRRGFVSEACEVDGAGGVEGFLRGADRESGAQGGVLVAVVGGGVDREPEGVS
jgi:hypothetical protein